MRCRRAAHQGTFGVERTQGEIRLRDIGLNQKFCSPQQRLALGCVRGGGLGFTCEAAEQIGLVRQVAADDVQRAVAACGVGQRPFLAGGVGAEPECRPLRRGNRLLDGAGLGEACRRQPDGEVAPVSAP